MQSGTTTPQKASDYPHYQSGYFSMKHRETAFIAMKVPKKGKPWFAISSLRWIAKDVRVAMIEGDPRPAQTAWRLLRKDGWSVVKVRVST